MNEGVNHARIEGPCVSTGCNRWNEQVSFRNESLQESWTMDIPKHRGA